MAGNLPLTRYKVAFVRSTRRAARLSGHNGALNAWIAAMTGSTKRESDLATNRWSKSFAAAALFALLLAACTSTPTKPDPPTVALDRVRILNIADGKASMSLVLRVTNPNSFELAVESIEYEIMLGGRQAASGRSARSSPLPAHGETTVELAGRVDVTAVATALMTLGSQLPVEYAFRGTVTLRDGSVVARFDRLYGSRPQ
jgi:LEA14-like dessication related protein